MKHTAIAPTLAAFVAAAFCTFAPLAAAGPKDADKKAAKPAPGVNDEEYRVGPGDKLRIEVSGARALSCSRACALAQDHAAAHRRPGGVQPHADRAARHDHRLAQGIRHQDRHVIVVRRSRQVYVMGGDALARCSCTADDSQVLAMAGGFKDSEPKDVKVLRRKTAPTTSRRSSSTTRTSSTAAPSRSTCARATPSSCHSRKWPRWRADL